MTTSPVLSPVSGSDPLVLCAAVSAYLGRYRGASRLHTGPDLRIFLTWRANQPLDPLASSRADIERYVHWLQEGAATNPRPCHAGGGRLLPGLRHRRHPAALARRLRPPPTVPPESPTLGQGHLQFEALITTARLSANPNDFALFAMLGLLGLRIFEACGAEIGDLGEEDGHRILRLWQGLAVPMLAGTHLMFQLPRLGRPGGGCGPGQA